jgi:hypothetical protein
MKLAQFAGLPGTMASPNSAGWATPVTFSDLANLAKVAAKGRVLNPVVALMVTLVHSPCQRSRRGKIDVKRVIENRKPMFGFGLRRMAYRTRRKCFLESRSEPHCKLRAESTRAIIAPLWGMERGSPRE